jgi:hypothetical integral membrane protein (TIGR02206 family)
MLQYFAYDYHGAPFVLFGSGHLIAIAILILLNFAMLGFRRSTEKTRRIVRVTMAVILWVNEWAYSIWIIYWGHWNVRTMLPLQLCSLLIWLAGFMLIFRNYRIYEFAYFLGIGGALQAFLTPNAGIYGFPHFRIFQTLIAHGLLITSAIYMTTVEGFRPTWKSFLRVFVVMNIYMVIIFFVNKAIGSNYLMINARPATASLIDLLPPWPYYLPILELIGIATCLILYLPFIIKDWRIKHRPVLPA